jgi:uncharacterized protein (UPF0332 family)
MSLKDYLNKGILVAQKSSKEEIENLLGIVDRDYEDSGRDMSHDSQFGIAYNAALKLATILLRASGYRVKGQGYHRTTIKLIPEILGKEHKDDSEYLDTCRRKRNEAEYDRAGGTTESEVNELRKFVIEFKKIVLKWLEENVTWNA